MSKVLSLRVPEELAEWAESEAAKQGITVQELLKRGLATFQADCERGIPELRAMAARQVSTVREDAGVGVCPKRGKGMGHVFRSARQDEQRHCVYCDLPGRTTRTRLGEQSGPVSYLDAVTTERTELFSRLRAPASVKGGKPPVRDAAA